MSTNITTLGVIEEGDRVRVLLKEKAFEKKYKPKWSKGVFTVSARRGRYVYVQGAARDNKYLRGMTNCKL